MFIVQSNTQDKWLILSEFTVCRFAPRANNQHWHLAIIGHAKRTYCHKICDKCFYSLIYQNYLLFKAYSSTTSSSVDILSSGW
jgi:hypothetical protein